MIISDLSYLKNIPEVFDVLGGETSALSSQINIATISQNSIAISFAGNAIATTSAMIVESNSGNSGNLQASINSSSFALSL